MRNTIDSQFLICSWDKSHRFCSSTSHYVAHDPYVKLYFLVALVWLTNHVHSHDVLPLPHLHTPSCNDSVSEDFKVANSYIKIADIS